MSVIKSFFTENGFLLSSAALQVWGGYGYVHDYGIEQSVRDSRIAMIYEGTNEIQAIDLLVRKVIQDRGRKFSRLLETMQEEAEQCLALPGCETFGEVLGSLQVAIAQLTQALVAEAKADPELGYRGAGDFMRLIGLFVMGGLWARAARVATPRATEAFYRDKLATARFYFDHVMPETALRLALLERRNCALPWVTAQA